MGAPYNSLDDKLENALKAFISSGDVPDAHLYTYAEVSAFGQAVEEPMIGVKCRVSRPTLPELQLALSTGHRTYDATIAVRSHAADDVTDDIKVKTAARDAHYLLVAAVLDLFMRSDIVAAINEAASGMGVQIEQVEQHNQDTAVEERSWRTIITFPIICISTT